MKKGLNKNLLKWIIIAIAVLLLIFVTVKIFTGRVIDYGERTCIDSDGGLNAYEFGYTYGFSDGYNYSVNDTCSWGGGKEQVNEGICKNYSYGDYNYVSPTSQSIECPYGCKNGACVEPSSINASCTDSDGGINYYLKGTTIGAYGHVDICSSDGKTLIEYYCSGLFDEALNYICPDKCKDGACVNTTNITLPQPACSSGTKYKICSFEYNNLYYAYYYYYCGDSEGICPSNTGIINVSCAQNKNLSSGDLTSLCIKYSEEVFSCHDSWFCPSPISSSENPENNITCNFGCLYRDKCLPYGYRMGNNYCNINNILTKQMNSGSCENNFECTTNLCVNGECVSPSLLQKIVNFFRSLFGI